MVQCSYLQCLYILHIFLFITKSKSWSTKTLYMISDRPFFSLSLTLLFSIRLNQIKTFFRVATIKIETLFHSENGSGDVKDWNARAVVKSYENTRATTKRRSCALVKTHYDVMPILKVGQNRPFWSKSFFFNSKRN